MQNDIRQQALRSWIKTEINCDFDIQPASTDASFRKYYRINYNNISRIVMDAPPNSESVIPFIKITKTLASIDIHVPKLHAENIEDGFLILEDLGTINFLDALNKNTIKKLNKSAIDALINMQSLESLDITIYSSELLTTELSLFNGWLLNKHLETNLNENQLEILTSLNKILIDSALAQPQTFVHRDYHSRNLMVTEKNNPGVIDFQDAVIGPITYDLVSLLKDCYIKWPEEEILSWVDYYRSIQPLVADIPRDQFIKWFDLMGIQRHLKAIGIFARLNHRDNKPGYLKDIPRTLSYIIDTAPKYEETLPLMKLIDELDLEKRLQ